MTSKHLALFTLILGFWGCSSSSDSKGGGSCNKNLNGDVVFSTVTKAPGSDAACPALTAADLNGGGDAGPSSCATVADSNQCTLDISCSDADTQTTGSFSISGSAISGTLSVTVTAASMTCSYQITGTVT